jgi:hypothetical protein
LIDPEDGVFEELLFNGAIEIVGIDQQSGEMLFNFTEKLKDVDPKLYEKMNDFFYQELLSLWEKGFISMDITQKNPKVSLTQKALDRIEVSNLTTDQRVHLEDIMRKLSE